MAECGFRVGSAFAGFGGSLKPASSKAGLSFGLHGAEYISSKIRYQFEINYVRKGVNTSLMLMADPTLEGETEVLFDYVEFPLLVKVDLGQRDRVRPVLFGGPYLAWTIEKDVAITFPVVSDDTTYVFELHNYPNEFQPAKSDWGFVLGLAFERLVRHRSFGVEVRYTRGIKKVVDSPSGSALSNSVLSVSAIIGL